MKRFIACLVLGWMLVLPAFALIKGALMISISASGGAPAATLKDTFGDQTDVRTLFATVGSGGTGPYLQSYNTASSSYTISFVRVHLKRNGAGTAPNFTMQIYNDNGTPGTPGTLRETSSTSKISSDITGSDATYDFTFTTNFVSGTKYWIGYKDTNNSGDDVNNYETKQNNAGGGSQYFSSDGSSWGSYSSRILYFEVWGT